MSPPARASLAQRVTARARGLGFSGVGVAPAGETLSHGFYAAWLGAGHAGEMAYLDRHAALKADPRGLLPGARSVLMVSLNYRPRPREAPQGLRGQVARYAWGADYHEVFAEKLAALALAVAEEAGGPVRAKPFADTAPVMEREWAARAGLGWVGKNGNLIHWQQGSWLFLGGLVLDCALDAESDSRPDSEPQPEPRPEPGLESPLAGAGGAVALGAAPGAALGAALGAAPPSRGPLLDWLHAQESCGECRACLDACPTGAIVADKTVDARRCIAYLTIEHRGPIARELRPQLGTWVFGCDVCQDVCPWNRSAPATQEPAFAGTDERAWPDLIACLRMDEAGFRARYGGSALSRTKRRGLARNAALALGNRLAEARERNLHVPAGLRDAACAALATALADAEAVVRGAAAWAAGRAGLGAALPALHAALAREPDADVREDLRAALEALAPCNTPGVA